MGKQLILVDTSAWVAYIRNTDTPITAKLAELIERDDVELAITEPIAMELLAGAITERQQMVAGNLVNGLPPLAFDAQLDFRAAAQLFAASRSNGHPIRSQIDCMIAAVAIRRDVPLLHNDRDFDYLAEISPLRNA